MGLVVAAGAQLAWGGPETAAAIADAAASPPVSLIREWGATTVEGLSWAVAATTVASGADYLLRGGLTAMPKRVT